MGLHKMIKNKKNILIIGLFLLIVALAISQEDTLSTTDTANATSREAETQMLINQDTEALPQTVQNSTLGIWVFLRTILVLVVVIAIIYGFFAFLKKTTGITDSIDPYLKKVATLPLSSGKTVYVVTLNSHAYLIGAADNSVNLIAEIDDKELVDAMNLHAPTGDGKKNTFDFSTLLNKFSTKPRAKTEKTEHSKGKDVSEEASDDASNDASIATASSLEFLKNQRNRISNPDNQELL